MRPIIRLVAVGVATAMTIPFALFGDAVPASADPVAVPSLVDDSVYPGRAQILEDQNVLLIAGDGHILLADCATPPVGDIGLLKVFTTDETIGADGIGRVCFQVTASGGWLTLQVPGVYEIRGDGQRTGTGHEVAADLVSDEGEHISVDVDPDGSTQVGLGADPNASPTMLLRLRAGDGLGPVSGANAAIGKVITRDERMCSATLVAPRWILTTASCFADNPLQPVLTEGPPTGDTGVVFPGHGGIAIDWVVGRTGRDVALGRLATPIQDITPIGLATTVAPIGTALPATGYGRNATEWTYDAQQTADITFDLYTPIALNASSGPLVCKGMAGASVVVNGKLAAVLSQAGQSGCFDATGTGSAVTAARTDDLTTWFTAITTTTADHSWSLADMPPGGDGAAVTTAPDSVFTGTARPLTATTGATWALGDTFSPTVNLAGGSASLASSGPAVATEGSFTVSAWVKPAGTKGSVLSQDGSTTSAFDLGAGTSGWYFGMREGERQLFEATAGGTVTVGQWTHLTATYNAADGMMKLYVDGVEIAAGKRTTAAFVSTGPFRVGASRSSTTVGNFFAGRVSGVQVWNRIAEPDRAPGAASYYQRLASPTRFLDTRTGTGTGGTVAPVARNAVLRLQIAGVNGIPATGVTAVALNLATILPQEGGYVTVWPDLTPKPFASSLEYGANIVTSEYMIVPVGSNGYINISPGNRSMVHPIPPPDTTTNIVADVNGYFTTNTAGVSSYTPVVPVRFADTRTGAGGHSGKIPANTTWNYKVTGVAVGSGTIPNGITAVAVNVTTVGATTGGYTTYWEQGQTKPATSGLQYQATAAYAGMSIVPVNPSTGQFSLSATQSTNVVIDILGYFAPGTAGQKYHAFASTGLIYSFAGGLSVPTGGTVTVGPPAGMAGANITQIVTLAVRSTAGGTINVYPAATTAPGTSTLNTIAGRTITNSAVVKSGTGGSITVAVVSGPSVNIGLASNGYFADS